MCVCILPVRDGRFEYDTKRRLEHIQMTDRRMTTAAAATELRIMKVAAVEIDLVFDFTLKLVPRISVWLLSADGTRIAKQSWCCEYILDFYR